MKRKPNNGAGPEPREAAGAADPGGAGEGNAGGTSGQSVPKSKFRQKSNQEKAAASKLRMEKRGEKLDRAKEKLAKQKPPKKPGPVRRVGRVASGSAHSFVHGKIYENEHENVGIEGAHRSELVGESALRHGSRFVKRKIREHPAKAVQKAESRYIKATADYHFHTAAQEHPELSKNALSRFWQKRRLRRRYQKQAKEAAKYGAQAAGKTAVTTEKLAARAVGFVKRHPVSCLLALACVLLVLVMQSCSSSLVTLGNSTIGAVGASTYPCEDGDMLGAEAAYCGLEAELQDYLDSYESTHDYDEYHFDLDEIEHDPYVLLSLLCSLHEGQWTLPQVEGSLQTLFDSQYILTEDVVVEVRYRTETRTDSEGNDYEVEVPYNYYICYVTLENKNLSHLPRIRCPGMPSIWQRWETARIYSPAPSMSASTPNRPRGTRCPGSIWMTKPLPPFSPRLRNISAIPMCGAAPARPHPLTVRAMCPGSSIIPVGMWAAWGPRGSITSVRRPAIRNPGILSFSRAPMTRRG